MRFEVNLSILFTELPLLERPAAAKQAGFDAVEFWWPWPVAVPVGRRDRPVRHGRHRRRRAARRPQLLRRRHGRAATGGWCRGPPAAPSSATTSTSRSAIGERLGCRAFNALYGNRVDDSTPEEQDDARRGEPRARGQGRAADRRHSARRAGQRRAPLPAAHRGRRARGDRPGRRRADIAAAVRRLPPRGQRRRRRRRDRRATRWAGSGTCRSPTPPAATSPAPASSTSTTTSSRIAATGYDGWVGAASTSPAARAPTPSAGCPAATPLGC